MIQTYETLEIAARDLIDAVNDCDLELDARNVETLCEAVAETCAALGDGAAAHKAHHRLARSLGAATETYVKTGGVDVVTTDVAGERVEDVAADVRGLCLPWHDRADPIDTCADVADTLDDLAREIDSVSLSATDGPFPIDTITHDDREAARLACERAAEVVREAGEEIERLRGDVEDLTRKRAEAATVGSFADCMADRIVETHEAGEPWAEILAAVAVTLREAGRHDAANLLTRP